MQGRLRPWGWARERLIRHGTGAGRALVRHRPRRGRCSRCAATHVLLEAGLAARRADGAAVIAAAIDAKAAAGHGHRAIAARLGRPASTVRGWLRAFGAAASRIAEVFTALVQRTGGDAAGLWPAPSRTPEARELTAVMAYARVLASRFGVAALAWQTAGLAGAGPFFFSGPWWQGRGQHELALMPGVPGGKGGTGAG